jgi:hypothetical protein
MVARTRAHERLEVQLPAHASARQQRELGAFARYCALRIERELGECEAWCIEVMPALGGFTSRITVRDRDATVQAHGQGHDGPLAIWDAMCLIDQRLREHRR